VCGLYMGIVGRFEGRWRWVDNVLDLVFVERKKVDRGLEVGRLVIFMRSGFRELTWVDEAETVIVA